MSQKISNTGSRASASAILKNAGFDEVIVLPEEVPDGECAAASLDPYRAVALVIEAEEDLASVSVDVWQTSLLQPHELNEVVEFADSQLDDEARLTLEADDDNAGPSLVIEVVTPIADAADATALALDEARKLIAHATELVGDQEQQLEDLDYSRAVAAASCLMAEAAIAEEAGDGRRAQMRAVLQEKVRTFNTAFPSEDPEVTPEAHVTELDTEVHHPGVLLVDLAFSEPFAPYDLPLDRPQKEAGLNAVAAQFGIEEEWVSALLDVQRMEFGAQSGFKNVSVAKLGVGAAALLALCFVVTPAGAAALGGMGTGLSGAAATAHGFALLGGGSVAAGGYGMAGGLWVMGAAAAAGRASARPALAEVKGAAGVDAATLELCKLQTTMATVYFDDEDRRKVAVNRLNTDLKEAIADRRRLEKYNDPGSPATKEASQWVTAIERAIASISSDSYNEFDHMFAGLDSAAKAANRGVRRARRFLKEL
jgi:hypothetical protein